MKIQVLIIFCFLTQVLSAQNNEIYQAFENQEERPGFDVLYLKDYSRPFAEKAFREIQVALWFPHAEENATNIRLKDYVQLYLSEEGTVNLSEEDIAKNEAFWKEQLISLNKELSIPNLLETEMLATRQAISVVDKSKKHPLVIYAAGGQGESFENLVLCEYLASKGFVVASIPSLGTDAHAINTELRGLNSQIRDMELVINGLAQYPSIDLENIGLMGWSWGGLAAMGLQAQNSNIKAVASLDGSIAGYKEVLEDIPGYALSKLNVPYLFFTTDESTVKRVKNYFDLLKYTDATLISFSKIDHGNFSAYRYLVNSIGENQNVDTEFYPLLTEITSKFFQKHLMNNKQIDLKKYASGQSQIVSLFEQKEAVPGPPSEAEFITLIQNQGIEKGRSTYTEVKKRDSSFIPFRAFELTKLAFSFARDSLKKDQAIPVMDLALEEYPKSYSTYALKGRIHEILEEYPDALLNFGKAYGLALELSSQKPGEEKVFYEDMAWYQEKISELKEKLKVEL